MIGWTPYFLLAILSLHISSSTGVRIALTPSEKELTKKTGDQFVIRCQLEDVDGNVAAPSWVKVTNGNEQAIPTSGNVATRVTGSKSVMLMFTAAKQDDAGEYKCKSGDESATVTVKLHRRITFLDETKVVQNPIVGQDAVIKCRADADPKPVISWSKDGEAIAENGGRFTVSDEGDLNIPAFTAEDNGEYTCEAVQSQMGDMQSLKITVVGHVPPGPPSIDLKGKEQWPNGVHEGATGVRLSCMATGTPAPGYTWFKGENKIENDHFISDNITGVLEFKTINPDDKGTYRCEASNAVGSTTAEFELKVFEKPKIEKIDSKEAMADKDIHFECVYTGSSPLSSSWTHDGNVIPPKADTEQTTESDAAENKVEKKHEKYVVVEEGKTTLYLKNVKLTDAGEYQCQVSNEAGTISEKANLLVQRAPLIVSSTPGKKVRGVLNTEYSMYCEALAVPAATFMWKKDGAIVAPIDGQIDVISTPGGDANHFVSTLKVIPMTDAEFGKYTCEASNRIDPAGSETIELIKIEKPVQPVVVCAEEQKPTIVTLNIETYSSATEEAVLPTGVDITILRKDDNSFVTMANLKFTESGMYKIPKLDPFTKYLFNVTGQNEAGTSESAVVECSTTMPAAPGVPLLIGSAPIRCNSTQNCPIAWSLDDTGGKPISKFHIEYYPVVNEGEVKESRNEYVDGSVSSFTFSDLKPKTNYQVLVRAMNDEGWGDPATVTMISPEASSQSVADVYTSGEGPGAGAIVGIVIFIVLLIIVLVDLACYYVNQCGLLMCICVNLCGKTYPDAQKSKEAMMEGGMGKETKLDETYEQKQVVKEQIIVTERLERIDDGTNETTPMISGGQNGHHERKDTVV